MRLFYFLARYFSYTFAVAFFVSIICIFETIFTYMVSSSFILSSYEKISKFFIEWLPIVLGVTILFHWIFSGLLTPIKIPAFMKRHRRINALYRANMKVEDHPKDYYGDFSDLVMNNTTTAVLLVVFIAFALGGISFYKFHFLAEMTFIEFKTIIRVVVLATIILVLIFGMSTHILGEFLTNDERTRLYNEVLRRGELIKPHALISVKISLSFFIIIMVIIIFTFAALLERLNTLQQINNMLVVAFIVISIASALYFARINSNVVLRILQDMIRVTREIASGRRAAFRVLSLGREFSSIEYALMEMAWEIDAYRRNIEAKVQERTEELEKAMIELKLRDEQIQKQLDMASVIQRSILPARLDDWNELKFSVRYRAMEKIGGDFYDVFQLTDNKIGILMADVSGHGIPAALVTAMAKISFGNAGTFHSSPKRIFQEVNKNIIDHMKTQDYMTCFMVAIDDDYNVTYSNASHQKGILLRRVKGEIEYLDTNGLFLGALEEATETYEENTTKMEYGDRLILYTDGIPEAQNENKEEYSIERFSESILRHRDKDLESFTDALLEDVNSFMGGSGPFDDISLLVVELVLDEAIDLIKRARKLINTHKYLDAIDLLEKGLEKYPDNQKILYNLGKNYFRINNYSKTVQIMEKYIQKDKKNKYAYYILGASKFQMLDYNAAIEQFNLALFIDPNMVNALFALGMCYKNTGRYDDAISIFERVLNIDSGHKMALFEIKQVEKLKRSDMDSL
jgi:sigma-B regulation protein RsbU (phosphoserine phosphatase)